MNRRHLLDISVILAWLTVLALTSQFALEGARGSKILNTVRVGSYMVLLMGGFLAVKSFWARQTGQDKSARHDRLSLWNIITHAYLMGAFIFVAMYSLLGESRDATRSFLLSLAVVSLEDVFVRTADKTLRRSILFFVGIMCAVSTVTIQGPSEAHVSFSEQRWFAIVFGWLLPASIPILFTLVRKKRYYNTVTVLEFLHFGMPFACMLACLSLVSIDLVKHNYENTTATGLIQRRNLPNLTLPHNNLSAPWRGLNLSHEALALLTKENATVAPLSPPATSRLISTPDVAIPLLSLVMLPLICSIIDKCLLYSTVDVLCTAAVVWAFKTLQENEGLPNALTVVSFVSASLGFCFRIYVCSSDENDYAGVAYTKEIEEEEEEEQMMKSLQKDVMQRTTEA